MSSLSHAAAWPVQGLMRRFSHVIDERIAAHGHYDLSKHFQKSWSGAPFANREWSLKHGGGKIYQSKA